MRIVTIGVYGFDEHTFVDALTRARIDVFVDTRQRRAVRGARYAFANSLRLQRTLDELDVRYVHLLELAPSTAIVQAQDAADRSSGVRRRDRTVLTPTFREAYAEQCLTGLDSHEFAASLGDGVDSILIFCVERAP